MKPGHTRYSAFACPEGAAPFCLDIPVLDGDESPVYLVGGERAYLHPKLMVGPAPEEIYGAVLLTFGP